MAITQFRWNRNNLRLLLFRQGVREDLRRRVNAIADACGGEVNGYAPRVGSGDTRARGAVVTINGQAIRDNAATNRMVRNLDAGR